MRSDNTLAAAGGQIAGCGLERGVEMEDLADAMTSTHPTTPTLMPNFKYTRTLDLISLLNIGMT
jgi:hypothetical protein